MGKLKDFFEAAVGFAAGSTLVGLVLGTVPLAKVVSTFIGSFKQNVLYFGLSYITSKGSEDIAKKLRKKKGSHKPSCAEKCNIW